MTEGGGQTLSSAMVLRLVKLLESRDVPVEPLLARAQLTRPLLDHAGARVPYAKADLLLELAAAELGPDGLGLELALTRIDESYGAAGLLLVTGSTFRSGLARSLAYQRLWGDGERFTLLPAGGDWAVRFRHPGPSALAAAITAECALTEVLEGLRALVDAETIPMAVELQHARLGSSQALAEHLGVEPRFEQPHSRIVIASASMDRPMHALRDLLGNALERQAARALSLLPARDVLSDRVAPLLAGEDGVVRSLAEIATSLRMSPRTLQRRLSLEGTSFQELVDRERQRLAAELDELGVPLKEAAFRLGFQDPSALSRARRRWRK